MPGFLESFTTGLFGAGQSLSGGFGTIAAQVAGALAVRGAGELGDLIFGKQKASGSPQAAALAEAARQAQLHNIRGPGMGQLGLPGGGSAATAAVNAWARNELQHGRQPTLESFRRFQLGLSAPTPATQPVAGLIPFDLSGSGRSNIMPHFPVTTGVGFNAQQAFFDLDISGAPGLPSLATAGPGTPMFRRTMSGARAQFFRTQNPATGQDAWFRPAGRPILWSGDLTACKRVNKVARRAARKR